MLREAVFRTRLGFHKFFVILRDGRVPADHRRYLHFVQSIFGNAGLSHCVIIFTFSEDAHLDWTKNDCLHALQADNDIEMFNFVSACASVLYADNAVDKDPDVETDCLAKRKAFSEALLQELESAPHTSVLPAFTTLGR